MLDFHFSYCLLFFLVNRPMMPIEYLFFWYLCYIFHLFRGSDLTTNYQCWVQVNNWLIQRRGWAHAPWVMHYYKITKKRRQKATQLGSSLFSSILSKSARVSQIDNFFGKFFNKSNGLRLYFFNFPFFKFPLCDAVHRFYWSLIFKNPRKATDKRTMSIAFLENLFSANLEKRRT